MKHTVLITDHAAKDLQGIFDYIANDLMSRQSAFGQLERLTKEIESLDEMPERYHKYTRCKCRTIKYVEDQRAGTYWIMG